MTKIEFKKQMSTFRKELRDSSLGEFRSVLGKVVSGFNLSVFLLEPNQRPVSLKVWFYLN